MAWEKKDWDELLASCDCVERIVTLKFGLFAIDVLSMSR